MRAFKFRAWDKENTMYDVEMLGEVVLKLKGGEWENIEDFVIMQFTGLTDKNGREIYEGDIVKIDGVYEHGKIKLQVQQKGVYLNIKSIVYGDRDFGVLDGEGQLYVGYKWENWARHVEVIGNRFDNPELLEVQK